MIQLRLQRNIGPIWMTIGTPEDAGDDTEDAECQALHWLAEIYCGSYPVDWPGPYRIEMSEGGVLVTLDHPLFQRFCDEESEAESARAEDMNASFRR
jgi:hypothetical protein